MAFFDSLFRRTPDTSPRPTCVEREWVGDIVDLLIREIEDYGVAGMEKWTILILDQGSPALLTALPTDAETGRYCILGHCEKLQPVMDFYPKFGRLAEAAVQDLAFEICKRVEPRWDAIVEEYHDRLAKWNSEQPRLR